MASHDGSSPAGWSVSNRLRARLAYATMQQAFFVGRPELYRETYPYAGGNAYSYLWPYSHALTATLHLAQLPDPGGYFDRELEIRLAGLEYYWNDSLVPPAYDSYVPPPLGSGGDRFYDDNVWIGLDLVRVFTLTGDRAALDRAERVFDFIVSGWDTDPTHPAPGGVFWTDADWSRERGTVSTGFGALLGFRIVEITGDPRVLDWAWKMYSWTNEYMLGPNGLYWDHVELDGTIDTWENSYNQGAMIAASLALARITGEAGYRTWAVRIANRSLDAFGNFDMPGAIFPSTNAIFFDHLMELEPETCDPRYRKTMQRYADRLWEIAGDDPDRLLRSTPDEPASMIDQAALTRLYARLAIPPSCTTQPEPSPPITPSNRQ